MQKLKICFTRATNPVDVKWNPALGFGYLKAHTERLLPGVCEFRVVQNVEEILSFRPDILGISSTSQDFEEAVELSDAARIAGVPVVVLGGFHITAFPDTLPRSADLGVLGEGEVTFSEVAALLARKGAISRDDFATIPGVVYWNKAGVLERSAARPVVANLDDLAMPDHAFGLDSGQQPYLFTSRGCAYRCSFCASSVYWPNVRFHSAERVIGELQSVLASYPSLQGISFWDDLFTVDRKRLRRIIELFKAAGLERRLKLASSIRANLINDELCGLLQQLNYTHVGFGAESGSERIIKKLKDPRYSVADNQRALDVAARHRFQASAGFVLGHYDETEEDVHQTYQFILDNYASKKLVRHDITILTPMPGTPLWQWAEEHGFVKRQNMPWHRLRYLAMKSNNLENIEEWIQLREQNGSLYLNEHNMSQKSLYQIIRHYEGKIAQGDFNKPSAAKPIAAPALPEYFLHRREEIVSAVPASALSVLDVGCAGGALGKALKELVPSRRVAGIEQDAAAAAHARDLLDAVYHADVETFEPPFKEGEFDCIVFADVLEHLKEPWTVLRRLVRFLRPGGTVVASAPNIRRLTVLQEVADQGRWQYCDEGILDRTHLRFFTKATFKSLLEEAGIGDLHITNLNGNDLRKHAPAADGTVRIGRLLLRDVSPAEFEELSALQFLFVGTYAATQPEPQKQPAEATELSFSPVEESSAPVTSLTHNWGFYDDEGGWRWMSETGQLLAPASNAPVVFRAELACGQLAWYAGASREQRPLEIALTIDGQTRQNLRFETDMQTLPIEQEIPASAKPVIIELLSNQDYVPAQKGLNQDQRHLSVRLINPRLDTSTLGRNTRLVPPPPSQPSRQRCVVPATNDAGHGAPTAFQVPRTAPPHRSADASSACSSETAACGRGVRAPMPRPEQLLPPTGAPALALEVHRIESLAECQEHTQATAQESETRNQLERGLIEPAETFQVKGWCALCRKEVEFKVDYFACQTVNGQRVPNWRERLTCPCCGLNNRMRASLQILTQMLATPKDGAVYITEQMTPLFKWLKRNFPNTIGSEFLGHSVPLGSVRPDGIRNEDLTALTFGAESLDMVVSFDVLEHVPDYHTALRECYRVLRPGGFLLFTAPFNKGSLETVIRAVPKPYGAIEHLLPPEYHGDPVNPSGGCLCYQVFGWDIIQELRAAGFNEAAGYYYWSRDLGYLGCDQSVIIATKPLAGDATERSQALSEVHAALKSKTRSVLVTPGQFANDHQESDPAQPVNRATASPLPVNGTSGNGAPAKDVSDQLVFADGFYDDEGGWRWMSPQGLLSVPAAVTPAVLSFELTSAASSRYAAFPFDVTIYVGDESVYMRSIADSEQPLAIQLPIQPASSDVSISLESRQSFIPDQQGGGGDVRELSVRISRVSLKSPTQANGRAPSPVPPASQQAPAHPAVARKLRFRGAAKDPAYPHALAKYATNPTVMFELSSRCNFHCNYCRSAASSRAKCFMKRELFSHLVRQAKEITTHPLRLHIDGEPTLHPEFLEMALEANAAGHSLALASNGSALRPEFLQIDMTVVLNLSCSAAELAARSTMDFARYHARLAQYLLAWKNGPSKQGFHFKIYASGRERQDRTAMERKLRFARKYVQDLGLGDGQAWQEQGCVSTYNFAKPGGGSFALTVQPLTEGGCYPNADGQACPGTNLPEDFGFCDSPWKVLAVLADGTVSLCCVDVTGETGCTRPEDLWQMSLKDLWFKHPALQQARQEFLEGKITRPICRKCLEIAAHRELYLFPELFPFPTK